MADEKTEKEEAAPSSGLVRTIIIGAVVLLVPAVAALAVFNFALRPMLDTPVEEEDTGPAVDVISEESVSFDFPDEYVHVSNEDPDMPDMMLQYQISFICDTAETLALVQARLTYFKAKVSEYHRNRTRLELNDPYTQSTIRNAIKQEANALLKRIKPEEDHKVLDVFHLKWAIIAT